MMFNGMKTSILVIAALATGVAAETHSGVAKYHTDWSGVSCGDGSAKDGTKYIMALNEQDFGGASFVGNSPACGNTITVNFGGKSVVVTVVSVGMMGLNNFDLSVAAFEQLSPLDPGHIDVTWSWDNGFNVATSAQDTANLAAMGVGGAAVSAETAAASTAASVVAPSAVASSSTVSGTPVAPVAAVETTADAQEATALAAGGDSTAPHGETSLAVVAPVAVSSSSVTSAAAARPTGYGGRGGGHGKRCAAQL